MVSGPQARPTPESRPGRRRGARKRPCHATLGENPFPQGVALAPKGSNKVAPRAVLCRRVAARRLCTDGHAGRGCGAGSRGGGARAERMPRAQLRARRLGAAAARARAPQREYTAAAGAAKQQAGPRLRRLTRAAAQAFVDYLLADGVRLRSDSGAVRCAAAIRRACRAHAPEPRAAASAYGGGPVPGARGQRVCAGRRGKRGRRRRGAALSGAGGGHRRRHRAPGRRRVPEAQLECAKGVCRSWRTTHGLCAEARARRTRCG